MMINHVSCTTYDDIQPLQCSDRSDRSFIVKLFHIFSVGVIILTPDTNDVSVARRVVKAPVL